MFCNCFDCGFNSNSFCNLSCGIYDCEDRCLLCWCFCLMNDRTYCEKPRSSRSLLLSRKCFVCLLVVTPSLLSPVSCLALCCVSLLWPNTDSYRLFRHQYMSFALYIGKHNPSPNVSLACSPNPNVKCNPSQIANAPRPEILTLLTHVTSISSTRTALPVQLPATAHLHKNCTGPNRPNGHYKRVWRWWLT